MRELDHKEGWGLNQWCFWTVVLKTLESPLDCKEIQPVHPKADQSWVFIGRTDAEAEAPILWPPDAKNWLNGKDPDAGGLKAGGEGDDRGWDGWMASPTQGTWVWGSSGRWWRIGEPGMLQSMGSQRVEHHWVTEQQGGTSGKENLPANAGDIRDAGLVPASRRSPRGGHGNPLQCSYLENPLSRGVWWATVHKVAQSQTWLNRVSMNTCKWAEPLLQSLG